MNKEHAYRFPPCPPYDIEGTESWLCDLAAQGLFLSSDGFFLGIGIFDRGEPRATKYRLEAAAKSTGIFSDNGGQPDDEAKYISSKLGWDYVTSRGQFYIYCSYDDSARELNTDPAVQAIAINSVRKRARSAVVLLVWWTLLYPILYLRGGLLLSIFAVGSGLAAFGAVLALWAFISSLYGVIHLSKLRKRLLAGEPLLHNKKHQNPVFYRIHTFLLPALIVVLLLLFVCRYSADIAGTDKIPLDNFSGNVPFATIADFADGEYSIQPMGFSNTVEMHSDLLVPLLIDWAEIANVRLPDGSVFSGSLYADYAETVAPFLAREAALEFQRYDCLFKKHNVLTLPQLDVDFAAAYEGATHFPTVVLQKGCKVVHATFYSTSSYTPALEEWVQILADSL